MPLSGWANRMLLDSQLNFLSQAGPVYLRIKNQVQDSKPYSSLGFQLTITGDSSTGFTDIEIRPAPAVEPVSQRNIGLEAAKLLFGATKFVISETFVSARMAVKGFTDPWQVWRDPEVIGLIHNNRLYSIESVTTEEIGTERVYWNVVTNAQETKVIT